MASGAVRPAQRDHLGRIVHTLDPQTLTGGHSPGQRFSSFIFRNLKGQLGQTHSLHLRKSHFLFATQTVGPSHLCHEAKSTVFGSKTLATQTKQRLRLCRAKENGKRLRNAVGR